MVDTTMYLGLREQGIALHRSQTSPSEVVPIELRRKFLTAERLRRVHHGWNGWPMETEIFAGTGSTTATAAAR